MKKIIACIPFARDTIFRHFFFSWSAMLYYARGRYDLGVTMIYGPYIDANRDFLISTAMKENPDYYLFLDDDQVYPENTPEILMNHIDSGVEIVGGVTPKKEDAKPMLWDWDGKKINLWNDLRGHDGLIKVDGMGLGGVMIAPSVFDKLEPPYFKIDATSRRYRNHGEDISFYIKCKENGIGAYCDTRLQYGHVMANVIGVGEHHKSMEANW